MDARRKANECQIHYGNEIKVCLSGATYVECLDCKRWFAPRVVTTPTPRVVTTRAPRVVTTREPPRVVTTRAPRVVTTQTPTRKFDKKVKIIIPLAGVTAILFLFLCFCCSTD